MGLSRIRMELARVKGFPEGSRWHGYEVIAPLTGGGLLDAEAWPAAGDRCTVRRFRDGEEEWGRHQGASGMARIDPTRVLSVTSTQPTMNSAAATVAASMCSPRRSTLHNSVSTGWVSWIWLTRIVPASAMPR